MSRTSTPDIAHSVMSTRISLRALARYPDSRARALAPALLGGGPVLPGIRPVPVGLIDLVPEIGNLKGQVMHPFITQKIAAERIKDMQVQATPLRHFTVAGRSARSAAPADKKARRRFSPAKADRILRRQLEKRVSWTVPERLRFLWYWFRLTIKDMHYVSGWLITLPPPPHQGSHESR